MSNSTMEEDGPGQPEFPTLYRVHYPGAQATYSEEWGFQAAVTHHLDSEEDARTAVHNHLNWECREPQSNQEGGQ